MSASQWTDLLTAIGSVITPVIVVVIGVILARRQNRNQDLVRTRIEYYKELAPGLNNLMCYMTFIGSWKDPSPGDILRLKRRLDHTFHCAAPLFNASVQRSYDDLMRRYFATFGAWGADARIISSAYRRREAWQGDDPWDTSWDRMFTKADTDEISSDELNGLRLAHDELLSALVRDLDITRVRNRYTTAAVAANAHASRISNESVRPPVAAPGM